MITRLVIKINTKYITLIEGKYSNNVIRIKRIFEIETPLQSYDNGNIKNIDLISHVISKCIKDNKISTKDAIFLINSSNVITRITNLPYVEGISDNLSMIKYELEQSMPIDLNQYNFIYKIINRFKEGNIEKADYVIHGIPKDLCDEYINLADKSGLKAVAIDMSYNNFEILEETKALINDKSSINSKINGFLNFDTDTIVLSVMNNGVNDFSRVIDKSLVTLENDFFSRFSMNKNNFMEYLSNTDITDDDIPIDEIENTKLTSLKISMEMIVEEISRYIKYYNSKNKGVSIDKIYIYGAYSNVNNLDKYLSTILGIQVERINNISLVQYPESTKLKISDNFENLLGFYSGRKKLQFLSLQNKAKNKNFGRLIAAFVVIVPCIIALLLYGYNYYTDYKFYKNEIIRMNDYINNEEILDLTQKYENIHKNLKDMDNYAEITKIAESLIKNVDIVNIDIFKDISMSIPDYTYIQSVQIGNEDGNDKLYLQCTSTDLASIAQFEKNLKDLDYIESSFITTINNGDSHTYVIICDLKEVNKNEAK